MIQLLAIGVNELNEGVKEFEGIDYNICLSDTPLCAFNQIIHVNPDVIILNMTNDGMDGKMVFQRIRKMQASKNVPVLLLINQKEELKIRPLIESIKTGYSIAPVKENDILQWAANVMNAKPLEKQQSVMVVDDDPVILDMVKLYIGAKYRVIALSRAEQVFKSLAQEVPDAILLDIVMPDVDGIEMYKAIRAVKGCESVPVLFQTGMAGVNTVKECIRLGAAGFVVKPIQKLVLLERLSECIDESDHVRRKKILIIDEFDILFALLQGYLRDEYTILRGPAALQSVGQLEDKMPDIVIINIDSTSFLLKRLREKADDLHIPLILMTQNIKGELAERESHRMNTSILELPLNRENVLKVIEEVEEWKEPPEIF